MDRCGEAGPEGKENCSSEPCKSTLKTPLKQSATSHSVLAEIQSNSGPLTTPPKLKEIPLGDPWTPTTNLKILISAASPEIRNREQKKGLQDSRSEILEAKHCLQEHLSGDEYEKSQPSRKEKSLGLLCHKFLARYPNYPIIGESNYICLDEVAEELTVERRRIYDIVNVLESLHMVSRLAKNRYAWHGRHNLNKTLQTLKKVGEENKYMQLIQLIKKREYENEFELDGEKNEETATKTIGINEHSEMCFIELPGMEFRAASVNSRKDKSLRVMSQKFVMLFLVSTPQIVSLEVAAKILIGEDHVEDLDKSKFKTKIRRLYDIANVLSSLELIKKVHVTEERGRKPAFKWTGPEVLSDIQGTKPISTVSTFVPSNSLEPKPSKEQCSKNLFPTRGKQIFTRHPSLMKLVKSIESDRRIHSAPTSPVKTSTTGCDQNSSTFPSKMAHLAAICKQQLEGQSSELKMKTKLTSNLEFNSKVPFSKMTTEEGDGNVVKDDTNFLNAKEKKVTKIESTPRSLLKRSQALQENSLIKKCKHGQKSLGVPMGKSVKNERPSSRALHVDTEVISFQERGQIKFEKLDQNMECCCDKERREGFPEDGSKTNNTQERPVPFAVHAHEALFPSGYLIPIARCTQHSNETTFSNKEKAGICSLQPATYSSPITGVIPVTASELTAVNIPAFHVSGNPVLQSLPISPKAEHVNTVSENVNLQQRKVLKNESQIPDYELNGKSVAVIPLQQQPSVPAKPKESQVVTENFFRTPGGPNTIASLSSFPENSDRVFQKTLTIPQRKLEVSDD
ncbi:transcription factor E2F8 isoform D [Alligator mississippiensis]|uniref:Transcription factor E2F8 n=1 Tax=Alligator mississippiensis TaxID=8496 RepID=A0A151MBI9_ALLMI|nr:transcription factor E2F8 isoform D [Alligator mississippiensis]